MKWQNKNFNSSNNELSVKHREILNKSQPRFGFAQQDKYSVCKATFATAWIIHRVMLALCSQLENI